MVRETLLSIACGMVYLATIISAVTYMIATIQNGMLPV